MRERRWLLLALYGLLLATAVAGALKATRPKFKIATTSTTTTTTEEPDLADNENADNEATTITSDVNATTGRTLTGIPQIDYIWDPNLPRELNGFNLSEYPFYSGIPEEITFKCDGLHDGFYASVAHKCQVYHHCLYGTRYDFLCANFTAFDQKTFICQFASEVDCVNSKKYWHRNDALYKAAETTTTSTSTTSTTTPTTPQALPPSRRPGRIPGRRPLRRRPVYDFYEEYYDDEPLPYERSRPRGYDRRGDYADYEERKYTRRDRERDRDSFRDRDYEDRDIPTWQREPDRPLRDSERPSKDDRDTHPSPRERFPMRNNRRDPPRSSTSSHGREQDDEPRNRNREPELSVDGRYSDKGFRDDYEDEPAPGSAQGSTATPGPGDFVKPSAPISSVYARPRAPPKIRRPVPLAEKEKFSYKVTSAPQITGEARRRPTEVPLNEHYYDDEMEEVRSRRPMNRRRPGFRDYYENPRERDRDRDRPFRPRYRDEEKEEEDARPRKHSDRNRHEEDVTRTRKYSERNRNDEDEEIRQPARKHGERNRERYYERGPERGRDRSLERPKDRANGESRHEQSTNRPERPLSVREREKDMREVTRASMKPKEVSEVQRESTRRPNIYDRTSVAPLTAELPKESVSPRDSSHDSPDTPEKQRNEHDEYSSSDEYYDEPESRPQPRRPPPSPPSPPRATVRIVKRPFLPSRGGNPNPRGLSLVGSKATEPPRRLETISDNDKRTYDAYKFIQMDVGEKSRPNDYEGVLPRPTLRKPDDDDDDDDDDPAVGAIVGRPIEDNEEEKNERSKGDVNSADPRNTGKSRNHNSDENNENKSSQARDEISSPASPSPERGSNERDKPVLKWNSDEYRHGQRGDVRHDNNEGNYDEENNGKQARVPVNGKSGYYSDTSANGNNDRDSPTGPPGNNKSIVNEVVTGHRLQDIPESEYDVTLNEALTPAFSNQEGNLPSGFVLPIHRQLARDPVLLQSTENSYKVSRPYNHQPQQQQQQQKTFVPSPQFLPLTEISNADSNEGSRSVQYFRTPEAVHVTGPQYRHQRGPWHDYTGY